MIIELKQVFDITGESLSFDYEQDLSQYELFSNKPFFRPVHIKGKAENRAGVVFLNYTAAFFMRLNCDRCGAGFEKSFNESFELILVDKLNTDSDEYFLVSDYKLDLDELSLSDILLSLPSKLLCSDDCKGLCSVCGANLNFESCDCRKKAIDPRLAVLSSLLENDD